MKNDIILEEIEMLEEVEESVECLCNSCTCP